MVSVAGALIVFVNALLRLQVGLNECASHEKPAMARCGCFINQERRRVAPPANVQLPLPRRFFAAGVVDVVAGALLLVQVDTGK
jgi:hypothetical protein